MGKKSASKKQQTSAAMDCEPDAGWTVPDVGEAGSGFGKLLASPERDVRERALRSLVRFLKARELSEKGLGELDLLKIWKGVFYCFWYTDKVPVQQEQAHALSMVVHEFKHFDTALMFYVCFLKTMQREWAGIDQYRVDKFYSLIRRMLRQILVRLDKIDWPLEHVETLSEVIMEVVMNIKSGIRYHICDIFLPELVEVMRRI
jgi:ribosomal RNA-processing protein 1